MCVRFLLLCLMLSAVSCQREASVKVGSKAFTEGVILGELATQLSTSTGESTKHFAQMGGTKIVFGALENGEIDIYADYLGTLSQVIFADEHFTTEDEVRAALQAKGIEMSRSLGFENSYALGMKKSRAKQLDIRTISDLAQHNDLVYRFSNEFIKRDDGWAGLRQRYELQPEDVKGMVHDLAYRQIEQGTADVMDVYTTDAEIVYHEMVVLEDDREFFPQYDAVLLYRSDLKERAPMVVEALKKLEGSINAERMSLMNGETKLRRITERRVAANFLKKEFNIETNIEDETVVSRIIKHTGEHLSLVGQSLLSAILFAIPLGIWAAKRPRFGQVILAAVGIVQTIPALALLVMLMGPMHWLGLDTIGSSSMTAIVALFLYSLLPIVRNTYTGLTDISPAIQESAQAIGLPPKARLFQIELPLASRTILAGIKTAAVLNVGFATLGALIGAGGYGQPILTGIRLDDTGLILQGAIPAAVLALVVQGGFELAERFLVPKGLRLSS